MKIIPWKNQKQHYNDALAYIKGRHNGTITSILTPWTSVNDATTNGLEWHSMTVMGGRPGTGKTTIKDQLIRDTFTLNTDKMRVLEFSLEMLGKTTAIRGMSAYTGESYKQLCSAEKGKGKVSQETFQKCKDFAKEMGELPIDVVESGPTVKQFEMIIEKYMNEHKTVVNSGGLPITTYTNTIITVDHSLLLEVDKKVEKSKNDMLYNLGTTLTRLKRKYPIAFIILSQLNRAIDHPDRNENGKYGNYVLESDIFGADALLQHADTVIGLNRPGKQKIRFYGPERYIVPNAEMLVMHFLKCRNGENGLCFFNTVFREMRIEEIATPPTEAESRARNITTKV